MPAMPTSLRAMVTCLGGAGKGTAQSLRLLPCPVFILGVDASPDAPARQEADAFEAVPRPSDPGYMERMRELAIRHRIDIVYPQATDELIALVKRQDELPCIVPAGNLQALEVASDKGLLYPFLGKHGVEVPQSATCGNKMGLEKAVRWLGYPEKKVVIKPRHLSGTRGFHVLDASADSTRALLCERGSYPFMRWEDIAPMLHDPLPGLVAMEYLEGVDFTCYALASEGEPVFIIPCRRLGFNQGVTLGVVAELNVAVMNYVERICQAFRFHGFVNVQLMLTDKGPLVYEVNPRLSATTVACTAAGVNVPWLLWQMFTGKAVEVPTINWGVRVERSWHEEFYLPEGKRPVSLAEAYGARSQLH